MDNCAQQTSIRYNYLIHDDVHDPKGRHRHFYLSTMIKQTKGEIWIGLTGVAYAMHAEQIEEKADGSVTFIRLVEYKGNHRKERISTRKEHIVYISETLEVD